MNSFDKENCVQYTATPDEGNCGVAWLLTFCIHNCLPLSFVTIHIFLPLEHQHGPAAVMHVFLSKKDREAA